MQSIKRNLEETKRSTALTKKYFRSDGNEKVAANNKIKKGFKQGKMGETG